MPETHQFYTPTDVLLHYLQAHDVALNREAERGALRLVLQELMQIDVSAQIAANRYERRGSRRAYRNGYRSSLWVTPLGEMTLRIPKLRQGTYYPDFLQSSALLHAIHHLVISAYVEGVSFGLMHQLRDIAGLTLTPDSDWLTLHDNLNQWVKRWRSYAVDMPVYGLRLVVLVIHTGPHRLQRYLVLAMGDYASQSSELLAHEQADYLDQLFWEDFLRRLQARGLSDVAYITSDNFTGLRDATRRVLGIVPVPRSDLRLSVQMALRPVA